MKIWAPLALAALLSGPSDGFAQGTTQAAPPRDRRITNGPLATRTPGPWTLTLSGFGGYDGTNLTRSTTDTTSAAQESLPLSGSNVGGAARLSVARTSAKGGLDIEGGTTTSYYSADKNLLADNSVTASEWRMLGRHTRFTAAQYVSMAPYYSLGLFSGLGQYSGTDIGSQYVTTLDSGIQTQRSYRYYLSSRVTHAFTDRTDISSGYSESGTAVPEAGPHSGVHQVDVRVSHRMTRSIGYHVGYGYGNTRSLGPGQLSDHNIDVGLDITKALSLTRRTVFSFSTGSTLLRGRPTNPTPDSKSFSEFRFLLNADLEHYIGRTWTSGLNYARDLQVLDGSGTPYYTDGLTGGLGGNLGQRTSVAMTYALVSGTAVGYANRRRDHASIASAWLQTRIRRNLSAYAQFSHYGQRFQFEGVSSLDLPQRFQKNSARVGLTLVLPRNRVRGDE